MTGTDKTVNEQRTAIKSIVRKSVDTTVGQGGTLSPRKSPSKSPAKLATKGPVLSPIKRPMNSTAPPLKEESSLSISPKEKLRPLRERRKSSMDSSVDVSHLLEGQSETTMSEEKDEDDAYYEDEGISRWINKEFLYSYEVEEAIKKIRQRRDCKRQFDQSDVHIFHLPQIIESGTPRIPFTPSINRDLSNFHLPEAVSLERAKKAKKKKKHYTEDEFGVYLNTWQSPRLGVNPTVIPAKTRLFRTQGSEEDDD